MSTEVQILNEAERRKSVERFAAGLTRNAIVSSPMDPEASLKRFESAAEKNQRACVGNLCFRITRSSLSCISGSLSCHFRSF